MVANKKIILESVTTGSAKKPVKRAKKAVAEKAPELVANDNKMPSWEIVLRVINPKSSRPRRMSLHTLAYVLGKKTSEEAQELANELEKSGKVVGYRCPDVQTLIFYLKDYAKNGIKVTDPNGLTVTLNGMIDTRIDGVWKMVPEYLKKYPFPKIKGFKRFAKGHWSGGEMYKGTYVEGFSGMEEPFEKEDHSYAGAIIKALKANGFTPGLEGIAEDMCNSVCGGHDTIGH